MSFSRDAQRLSSTGREQARLLGEALKLDPDFNLDSIARVFVSNYRRTRETAHYVLSAAGFNPQQKIELNPTVGERDWGDHYLIDEIERQRHYQLRKEDPFCWSPEAGESMRHTRERVNHLFATLNRRFGGERVLVFTHGEFIISAMAEIQRVYDQEQFGELLVKGMPNCGVVQFSRLSPEGEESQYYSHIRRFAAGDLQGKYADWNGEKSPIVLPNYTLENLLLPPSQRSSRLLTLLEQQNTNP
jgi:broad specificity phosphatase PhoE